MHSSSISGWFLESLVSSRFLTPSFVFLPGLLETQLSRHDQMLSVHDIRLADMDLRFQVLETASYNGVLIWKIRDYKRRKQEAVMGKTLSLYSQPFYTGYFGYKMCARVYLNGDGMGKGTHLSLFFVIMRGEYDALLPWPFKQKVTLMLMDQGPSRRHLGDAFKPDPNSSSFKKPTGEMNIASGCPVFVAQTVLENGTYIKDDTIFIKVIVDTSDLPDPWHTLGEADYTEGNSVWGFYISLSSIRGPKAHRTTLWNRWKSLKA